MSWTKRCWPTKWIEAAVASGLATQPNPGVIYVIGGKEASDKLEKFATMITEDKNDRQDNNGRSSENPS